MLPIENFRDRTLKIGGLCLAGGLLLLSVGGCGRATSANPDAQGKPSASDSESNLPRIETVRVERRDVAQTIEMPGTVEGYETADLYAKVGGYLEEIHVDIGDPVAKGQEVARLHIPEMQKDLQRRQAQLKQAQADVAQAEAAVNQASAMVTHAEASLEEARSDRAAKLAMIEYYETENRRYQSLVDRNAARQDLLDQAKYRLDSARAELTTTEAKIRTAQTMVASAEASLAKAKADLESARANVDVTQADLEYVETMMKYATIRAPFDGQVTRRWVDPGAFIQSAEGNSPAKPLLTITRLDRVRIALDLPMAEVRFLERGDRAVLDRINVLPGESFESEITRFSPALNLGSRMMRVEIHMDNPEQRLRPGYYGYVTIFLNEYPDSPVVPSSALLSDGNQKYVYIIRNNVAIKQAITTNYEDGIHVGIASGLEGGEHVIRAGGGQIADGQKVISVLADAEATPTG
ncbi:efflux RND transporter periplasmic adaptor subunit [soil metagenome]